MNKKFLSAILFGALMVTSTGTFVSCKDYDDDIDRIDTELSDLKSKLDALQTKVDGGKYVTNVTKDGEGIVITWNDNTTSKIETIKGDKGDAVEITIDPVSKNWIIDGEDTGVCAEGKDGEAANGVSAKSPSIDPATGNWVVYTWDAEKEEYVGTDTGVSAKGASAYVVDEGNYYTLNVAADKAGTEYTTVKLPKSPVIITEMEVLGLMENNWNGTYSVSDKDIKYNFHRITTLNDEQKEWNKEEGVKKLAAKQVLSTLGSSTFVVRMAPAKLDASLFSFALVNSKLGEAPIALGTPYACNDLMVARSVSGNGLWAIDASSKEGLTFDTDAAYEAQFKKGGKNIHFAMQEKDGFTTLFDLIFTRDEQNVELPAKVDFINASYNKVKGAQTTAYAKDALQNLTDVNLNYVSAGDVYIGFDNVVYDAHLHFDAAVIERWGIEYSGNGTAFVITSRPDDVTSANFQVEVHYVALDGDVKKEYVPFKVAKSYADVTTLPAKTIEISANNDNNKFENSLQPMFDNLGANTNKWKADVATKTITYQWWNADANKWETASNITATLDKTTDAELKDISKLAVKMNANTVAMKLNTPYRVVIAFKDVNGEVLNQVIQPITFTVPAMSHIFVEQPGVFVNGVAYAYMDATANRGGAAKAAAYNLKGAFVDLAKKMGTSTFNADLDAETKVVGDYKSTGLAELSNVTASTSQVTSAAIPNWTITLKDVEKATNGTQKGYGKELIVNITNVKYLNIYEYKDQTYTFKIVVLSPILEGKVTAVGGEVIVPATKQDGYKVNDSHIKGYTYNEEVYSIFSDAKAPEYWKRKEINSVKFATGNENVFTCDETGTDYTESADGKTKTYGSVTVYPKNLKETTSEDMTVTVKDAWGYTLTQKVKVTVKVGE